MESLLEDVFNFKKKEKFGTFVTHQCSQLCRESSIVYPMCVGEGVVNDPIWSIIFEARLHFGENIMYLGPRPIATDGAIVLWDHDVQPGLFDRIIVGFPLANQLYYQYSTRMMIKPSGATRVYCYLASPILATVAEMNPDCLRVHLNRLHHQTHRTILPDKAIVKEELRKQTDIPRQYIEPVFRQTSVKRKQVEYVEASKPASPPVFRMDSPPLYASPNLRLDSPEPYRDDPTPHKRSKYIDELEI